MSINEGFAIKSYLREYRVEFSSRPDEVLAQDLDKEHLLIIDKNVRRTHGERLGVTGNGKIIEFDAVEKNKRLGVIPSLVKRAVEKGISKRTNVIVIGGGITQDVGGFMASILFRGLEWNFYPTTLLAQADSCIGSKTSINVESRKNQVGNFYPPSRVVISSEFLQTLSPSELKSGYGEIIKAHLLAGEKDFQAITQSYEQSFINFDLRQSLIETSLKIKKTFIEEDEFDLGVRNLLNYGHTFGHALESATKYQIPHGQAVTIGMDIANYISWKRGLISREMFSRIRALLRKNFPKRKFSPRILPKFLEALKSDKKNIGGKLVAILTHGPGQMEKTTLSFDNILNQEIENYFRQLENDEEA